MFHFLICIFFLLLVRVTDMEEAARQSFGSKLSNNARPPIQPAAAGKGSSVATAARLAVPSHALRVVVVFVPPLASTTSPAQAFLQVHCAATTAVVAFGLYYTHLR
jgi:hypothetical protein